MPTTKSSIFSNGALEILVVGVVLSGSLCWSIRIIHFFLIFSETAHLIPFLKQVYNSEMQKHLFKYPKTSKIAIDYFFSSRRHIERRHHFHNNKATCPSG